MKEVEINEIIKAVIQFTFFLRNLSNRIKYLTSPIYFMLQPKNDLMDLRIIISSNSNVPILGMYGRFRRENTVNKNNNVFSIDKILILSSVVIISSLLLTWITEKFSVFPIKNNIETMLFTIWSVQATVSTLTIAILALLISLNKEKSYGIKILEFMLISNRKLLTFQDEILIILLLIVFQYIFVSFLWLSGSLFLFIFGFIIIIRILYISIKIILFEEQVQRDISNYIIDSIKIEITKENEECRGNKSEENNK